MRYYFLLLDLFSYLWILMFKVLFICISLLLFSKILFVIILMLSLVLVGSDNSCCCFMVLSLVRVMFL